MSEPSVVFVLETKEFTRFFPLLQLGFGVKARPGCSVKALLCHELGVSTEYLEARIKTVFLDGKPVDDINEAIIKTGSTVALSAAMPGLAGATMRTGGVLAALRGTITHRGVKEVPSSGEGMVTIKLFNLLMKELGPAYLGQGVWIRRDILEDFLRSRTSEFWRGCKAEVNGEELNWDVLPELRWPEDYDFVLLKVCYSQ